MGQIVGIAATNTKKRDKKEKNNCLDFPSKRFHLLYFYFCFFFALVSNVSASQEKASLNEFKFQKSKILPHYEAFKFSAKFSEKGMINLRWEISEHCYLYKNNFGFILNNSQNTKVSQFPKGVKKDDEYFGEVEVFYSFVETYLKINSKEKNEIRVTYQGCNEKGFCYPPIKKVLSILPDSQKIVIN